MPRILLLGSGIAIATLVATSACGVEPTVTPTAVAPHTADASHTASASHPAAADTPAGATTEPPLPPRPATTSGRLTMANLPPASRIGPGFQSYAEPDNPEEGIVSNGSAVHVRDPRLAADGIVPLGCPGLEALPRLPVPTHALEETYRTPQGLAAVALTLEYGSVSQAARLVDGLGVMLAACTPPTSTAQLSTPRLVAEVRRPDAVSVFDTRREVGPDAASTQWDETVVRVGKRVSLVIVERSPKAPVGNQRALASDLRTLLAK